MTIPIKPRASGALSTRPYDPEDRLGELRDDAVQVLGARIHDLESAMQQRPLLAIGIGVALGYVLARLLSRA